MEEDSPTSYTGKEKKPFTNQVDPLETIECAVSAKTTPRSSEILIMGSDENDDITGALASTPSKDQIKVNASEKKYTRVNAISTPTPSTSTARPEDISMLDLDEIDDTADAVPSTSGKDAIHSNTIIEDSGYGLESSAFTPRKSDLVEGSSTAVTKDNDSDESDDNTGQKFDTLIDKLKNPRDAIRARYLSTSSSSSSVLLEDIAVHPHSASVNIDNASNDSEEEDDNSTSDNIRHHSTTTDDNEDQSDLSDSIHLPMEIDSDDSDSDDDLPSNKAFDISEVHELLTKPKPIDPINTCINLMRRENGFFSTRFLRNRGSSTEYRAGFESQFYSARQTVERMTMSHMLNRHAGCVNSLNFNKDGSLLVSGSDDQKIIIWDWANNKIKYRYESGHTSNIFQTKFVEMNGALNIISSGRDGHVRYAIFPSSGSNDPITKPLYKHSGAVHKIVLTPDSPYEIFSAGEDGYIMRHDLREEQAAERIACVENNLGSIRLFSIAHHPFDKEFCVCGSDPYVRVYDKRNYKRAVQKMCPISISEKKKCYHNVTCAMYNYNGSEILASYTYDHLYLFNNRVYIPGQYTHQYKGHMNHKTIKGVNFFGPKSEYVISGSDCGNIFFWDKNNESILNWMKGDRSGVVNCLESHPSMPVLATSGLDYNIKIWTPSSKTYPPELDNLEKCVTKNLKHISDATSRDYFTTDTYLSVRRFLDASRHEGLYDSDYIIPSSSDDEEENNELDSADERHLRHVLCNTQ